MGNVLFRNGTALLCFGLLGISSRASNFQNTYSFLGCGDFRSQFFSSAYDLLRDGVSKSEAQLRIEASLNLSPSLVKNTSLAKLAPFQWLEVKNALSVLWKTTLYSHPEVKTFDSYEIYKRVAGAELGDSTTPERVAYNRLVDSAIKKVESVSNKLGITCEHRTEEMVKERIFVPGAGQGALKFFKVFYQDCQASDSPPFGPDHADLEGVKVIGRHPAGGNKRVIGDLEDVLRTHYHLKEGGEYGSQCFNWRQSPPIYDFGGKPYASSTHLNFFKNAGSGTSVLGIDCSAVVISALAAVGRRPKKDVAFKPDFVHNVNSSMLKEPQSNGLSCLTKASFSESDYNLKAGDILAISGHVTIVSEVGNDPWGLSRIFSVGQCNIDNFRTSRFDFKIIQSAPVKGAIGVTRMNAKDYYTNSGNQGKALRAHAVNACLAKFGSNSRANVSYLSVVRHKDESGCLQSPVPMEKQSCVSSCI
ncbi:hypothetical protein GW915_02445 [bacterium]|nr:hypothetical protein [bacterium]